MECTAPQLTPGSWSVRVIPFPEYPTAPPTLSGLTVAAPPSITFAQSSYNVNTYQSFSLIPSNISPQLAQGATCSLVTDNTLSGFEAELPTGIHLNNCALSGTPFTEQTAKNYQIQISDPRTGDSATTSFSLTITGSTAICNGAFQVDQLSDLSGQSFSANRNSSSGLLWARVTPQSLDYVSATSPSACSSLGPGWRAPITSELSQVTSANFCADAWPWASTASDFKAWIPGSASGSQAYAIDSTGTQVLVNANTSLPALCVRAKPSQIFAEFTSSTSQVKTGQCSTAAMRIKLKDATGAATPLTGTQQIGRAHV